MTSDEQNEVIEKILFGNATPQERKLHEIWMGEDREFVETFEFRKSLAAQLRLKKRNELKNSFKVLRDEEKMAEHIAENSPAIPLWRSRWFLIAASVVGLLFVFQITRKILLHDTRETIAKEEKIKKQDPLQQTASKPEEDSNAATKPTPKTIIQSKIAEIPFYESEDSGLGFGKSESPNSVLTAIFYPAKSRSYEFEDTLKIHIPESEWNQKWSVIYNRSKDEYILSNPKEKYQIINGLTGKKLLEISSPK